MAVQSGVHLEKWEAVKLLHDLFTTAVLHIRVRLVSNVLFNTNSFDALWVPQNIYRTIMPLHRVCLNKPERLKMRRM